MGPPVLTDRSRRRPAADDDAGVVAFWAFILDGLRLLTPLFVAVAVVELVAGVRRPEAATGGGLDILIAVRNVCACECSVECCVGGRLQMQTQMQRVSFGS